MSGWVPREWFLHVGAQTGIIKLAMAGFLHYWVTDSTRMIKKLKI